MDNCIFCQIAAGEMTSDIIYKDDEVIAFNDMNPEAPTHFLVVPRRHITNLEEAKSEDAALIGKLMTTAALLARQRNLETDGYRVVMNVGKMGGQTMDHIHLHFLGGRFMKWPPG